MNTLKKAPGNPAPTVHMRNVGLAFGSVRALNNVSLDVLKGEFFCLLGRSGSGKSSLLRVLAGLEAPHAGTVFIAGADMAGVPAHRRPTNMMFQSYALFPHLSVFANIAYGLKRARWPGAKIRSRVTELLELTQMTDLGDRRPHQLSGGQRQRVALARALTRAPDLLLLDEPLAALDPDLRAETGQALANIKKSLGTTFIMVTHDPAEAIGLAHRMAIMEEGEIIQTGTPRQIYHQPETRLVARFTGAANLFEAHVLTPGPGAARLAIEGGEIVCHTRTALSLGQKVWLVIRPEHMNIFPASHHQGAAGQNRLTGTMENIAFGGPASTLTIRLPSGEKIAASRTGGGSGDGPIPRPGQAAVLSWSAVDGTIVTS
jgi:putrescine transport system ATP-binding protein